MSSEKLVANELLAFLQDRLDVMDEVSAMQICTSSFSENEIRDARTLLYESLNNIEQMRRYRRDERGERSLQDIISVLKVTDPDDVPAFVARNLHRVPPLDFDHIDCTSLLKDIKALKSTVATMQLKLEAAQSTISDLRTEVASLRNSTSVTGSPAECNVNPRRGAQLNASACTFVSTLSSPAPAGSPRVNVCPPAPQPRPALAAAAAPARPAPPPALAERVSRVTSTPQRDYAAVAASQAEPERPSSEGMKQKRREPTRGAMHPGPSKDRCDKEGFVLVERKKRKPTCRNQCGTAAPNAPGQPCLVRAAVPTTQLYVSRVHYSVKPEGLVEFLKQKTGLTMRVEKLVSRRNVNFSSFVVRVPTDRLSTYMDSGFWPKGVVFRKFIGSLTRDTAHSSS